MKENGDGDAEADDDEDKVVPQKLQIEFSGPSLLSQKTDYRLDIPVKDIKKIEI
jgi:hypothetical protein